MYSFRYHLVAIVSIFLALALGLLLGAAIASSEVVQSTSDDMVESMLSRYEELVDSNERNEQTAENNASLSTTLTRQWSEERLDGRTIVMLLGNTMDDMTLRNELTNALSSAGASVVQVTVLKPDLGLENEETLELLQSVVEEVPGEDYQLTLTKELIKEWSYTYVTSSIVPSDEDLQLTRHSYIQVPGETLPSGTQAQAEGAVVDGGLSAKTPFQQLFFDRYKLTRAMLSLQIISINTDYSSLTEHADPEVPAEQLAALHVAGAWQLPYSINGLVNGFAAEQKDATQQAQFGVQMALRVQEAGNANDLSYPSWLKVNLPKSTSGEVALPNYYALLIQPSNSSISMESIASASSISCVTSPLSVTGEYSVLALLSGAQAGTYGDDRPAESRYAPLPEDSSGRAPFRR